MVGEVVEADAEEENAVVLPPYEALGDAQVDAEDAAFVEGIAVEACGAGRDGVSAGAVEIGGGEGVDGARTAGGDYGREVEVLAEILQPLGRSDIVEGKFEETAGDHAVGLILAGARPIGAGVGGVERLLVEIGSVVARAAGGVSEQVLRRRRRVTLTPW